MTVDYPDALPYFVNENRVFVGALVSPLSHYAIVIHKTACGAPCTAEQQGIYFQTNTEEKSVHYVVGKNGTVVQCVAERDGAGGNCCLENGHDLFWDHAPTKSDLNLCTFSIEHCDYSNDNSEALTQAQRDSSFRLVAYLCRKYAIGLDRIKGHNTLDPFSRKNCPGNYPWNDLFTYLKEPTMAIPAGWSDNPAIGVLTASNRHVVIKGFRDYILGNPWDHSNVPLESERSEESVLQSDISLGPGSVQCFRDNMLLWTSKLGVNVAPLGQEYLYVVGDRDRGRVIISELQHQIDTLKAGIPANDVSGAISSVEKLLSDLKAIQ